MSSESIFRKDINLYYYILSVYMIKYNDTEVKNKIFHHRIL